MWDDRRRVLRISVRTLASSSNVALVCFRFQEHKLDYKQLMAEYKAIKEGKSIHRNMCKWADECKYKHKCRYTHPCDLRKEEEEKKAADPVQLSRCVRV